MYHTRLFPTSLLYRLLHFQEPTKVYMCRHCGKTFKGRSGLYQHEKTHEGKAPYKCCGKLFFSAYNHQIHRAAKHNAPRPFKCADCSHTFATKSMLTVHRSHHEARNWTCKDCNKAYHSRSALLDHMSSHTEVRKYRCHCGKSYMYSQGLSNHKVKCRFVKDVK